LWFLHGGAERAGQQGVSETAEHYYEMQWRSRKNRSGRTRVYIGWWIGKGNSREREGAGRGQLEGGRESERAADGTGSGSRERCVM